ncbi:MAG: glycosyltransferase family 39 protein [Gemmatimonadota bacterium]|nr:glycosyltransferase family 39 protein [Gemmatimonadota bacterium]
MSGTSRAPFSPAGASLPALVWALATLSLALHLLPRPGYGFHRDELLYLAMGDHLDLFRMQFPPVIAVLAELARLLPLNLLVAIHLLSGLAAAAVVVLTARIAGRLGGAAPAQALAALAVLSTPFLLRAGSMLQPVIFEFLWWTAGALALVSLLAGADRRWWLALGAVAGLGASTKFTTAVFALAAALALLASPLRRDLAGRWPWLGLGLATLLASPALAGQAAWGWPFLTQLQVLRESQLERVTPAAFLTGQLLIAFAAAPLLVLGAIALWVAPLRMRFWPAGLYAAAAAVILLLTGGKEYYLAPIHPLLIAAGATALLAWTDYRPVVIGGIAAWLVVGGAIALPAGIPILRPGPMAAYLARIGITRAVTTNYGEVLPLPQDYADMLGWREQVAAVAEVYHRLDPAERARTSIVGGNYGRAGALAVYHAAFGLPYPVSRHGDFYHWGFGNPDATTVIIVGGTVEELSDLFGEVTLAAVVRNPQSVPEEQEVRVHLCRLPRKPLPQIWQELGPVWG